MSWLALFLLGVAVCDLVRSVWRVPAVPAAAGGATTIVLGLLADLTSPRDVVALVVAAAAVVAWGQSVELATPTPVRSARLAAWVPLAVLGGSIAVAVAVSVYATPGAGLVGEWLDHTPLGALRDLRADRGLLVAAALLLQLSTGNVIVRLVLAASGTLDPARRGGARPADQELKGGRLLGPMERIFILGLGLAGHVTAASIVIAAKGLIRWPELQAKRGHDEGGGGPDIDEVTEYFLVGSFMSWLVALAALALLA